MFEISLVFICNFRHTVHMTEVRRGVRALKRVAAWTMTVALVIGGVSAAGSAASAAEAVPQSVAEASASVASVADAVVKTADLSKFQPGNIISDAAFFNSGTMSEAQIQSFLQSKVPTCQSGYTCLKDWYDTSRTTSADAMCGAYSGGIRERASTIIFRVAQACGINPQVLLVMLQKEQGLVTHTWPSDFRYQAAMGQGCPDTAACDTRYYGFFNQMYGAAWQMKRYANPAGTSQYFTWYAPGKTWNVRWHPNEGCGSSPVYIQNQATANLYYYTPYQPNAAAIRAGYGEGDGCSSYGNRNFFQYFNDWFGSTQRDPAAEIEAEYQAQGGASVLGAAQSGVLTIAENGGGYARAYAGASIYWTWATGARTVLAGSLRDYYFVRGGAAGDVGWPAANQQSLTTPTAGTAQLFTGGSLYSSPVGTFIVRDPIRQAYFSSSGATGQLGWPTSDQLCASGVCSQKFERGSVVSSPSGAFAVSDPVRSAFDAAGGATGSWGVPVSALMALPHQGGGAGQAFANGSAYYRDGGPAFFVSGAIRSHYFALGGAAGKLGYPTGNPQCVSAAQCQQEFQFGWILWTSSDGARIGAPAIDTAYEAAGGAAGVLGARAGTVVYYSFNGGGLGEVFANGAIFYKTATGAHAVTGPIRATYFSAGGAAGSFGWPSSDQTCVGGACRQDFEGASVVSSGGGVFTLVDPVRGAYDAAGGISGTWGVPVSAVAASGPGFGQAFANGSAYYVKGGPAFFVSGEIRDYYFGLGGSASRLGYPMGEGSCAGGACQQEFQFGWIITAPGSTPRIGSPAIDAAYTATGGAAGVLGVRSGSLVYYSFNGGGFAEAFAGGAVYFKKSIGTAYAVSGSVRDAYFTARGAAGAYGWPTSAMTCTSTACSQNFEGGTIVAAP